MQEHEKVLVTGAHGFIGQNLVKRLTTNGQEICELPRSDWNNLAGIFASFSPDRVFHLAAYGNQYDQKDLQTIYSVNIVYLLNLLISTQNIPLKSFVNVGSSSEYGRKNTAMKEQDILEPDTYYAASKAAGTLLARAWAVREGQPVVTIRPFSVYGPGEADGRFIPRVITCAMTGETLPLSSGVHDWIFIDDFIEGMIAVADHCPGVAGQVINLGTGVQSTNQEIVEKISLITGKNINLMYTSPLRNYDTETSWVADITKAKSLGWSPKTPLEEGLQSTVEHYARKIN